MCLKHLGWCLHIVGAVPLWGWAWWIETMGKGDLAHCLICFSSNMLNLFSHQGPALAIPWAWKPLPLPLHSSLSPFPSLQFPVQMASFLERWPLLTRIIEWPSFSASNPTAVFFTAFTTSWREEFCFDNFFLQSVWHIVDDQWIYWRHQAPANVFSQGPDSKCCRLCGPYGLWENCSARLL